MKNRIVLFSCLVSAILFGCNTPPVGLLGKEDKMVLRFELDSTGNIKDEEVKQQLVKLANDISKNADRVTLNAYSEQTGNKEKNEQIAFAMADAAKKLMVSTAERAYYNVGVNVVGYANPINPANPADSRNRRIEFTYMN